ncbi:MAG TPA: acyl carrier protein [Gemmataceae bacterium]|nr:acyl carrier protein [Gemmataceae bacterium]
MIPKLNLRTLHVRAGGTMTNSNQYRQILIALVCVLITGCSQSRSARPDNQEVVDRVRSAVAKILKKDARGIDVTKPLAELGADDLDLVEIVMVLEDEYQVEIPDSEIAGTPKEVCKELTVQKLAEIVSRRLVSKN